MTKQQHHSKKWLIIILFLLIVGVSAGLIIYLFGNKKPTTPSGDKTFSSFEIKDNNIPTNLTTGYSLTSTWTQTVTTSPTADSIIYTLTNVDDGLRGKLSVSSVATGAKLDLATGCITGTYKYTIHGDAHKDGYTDYATDKTCSIIISNGTFSVFTINDNNIPENLTIDYSATSWTQTKTIDPTADSIDYSLTNVDDGLRGKLSVSSVATGAKLDLATGVGKGTYAYTIHGVAHKTGYNDFTTDKICTLTILGKNQIKLVNDDVYTIDVTYNNFLTNRAYSGTFNFNDTSGVGHTITRTDIKEIYLTDLPQITTAPDSYLKYMCNNMTNLTVADIVIPTTITSTGRDFCASMFNRCTSLTSLPSGFNLPQNITSVGHYFCSEMFGNCTFTSLPSGFNLPQTLTSVGGGFCRTMFAECTNLTSLPSGFNLPQNITSVNDQEFCQQMFYGCSQLSSLPSGFNLPQNLTSVGNAFCYGMFNNCALTSLPSGFTLPQNITTVGNDFCRTTFNGCTSLTSLPSGFTLPQNITTVTGEYFCYEMFRGTGLTSLPTNFNLPQNLTSCAMYFCSQMFYSCTSLTSLPSGFNIPQSLQTINGNCCRAMFNNCQALTSLPSGFNLPQGITNADYGFEYLFNNCTSLTSLPSGFNLPQGITSANGGFRYMFQNCRGLKNDSTNKITINIPNITSNNFCDGMFANCSGLTGVPVNPTPGSTVQINAN